jgi:hypothetical protein
MSSKRHPAPRLTQVYHLQATLGQAIELGETSHRHRRIVPLSGGTFAGLELHAKLLPGASADWQTILPDGTALGDISGSSRTVSHRTQVTREAGPWTS